MDKVIPAKLRRCAAAFAGFSLVELLLVTAVIVILASLSGLAFSSVAFGSALTQAGSLVTGTISQARQEAVARNQEVRVLFYQLPDGGQTNMWNAIQVCKTYETNEKIEELPLSRITRLPTGVIFSPLDTGLSPLLGGDLTLTNKLLPNYGTVPCIGFRFRPNGALPSRISVTNNYLTLVNSRAEKDNAPANYYTLQVNTVTGKISVYRP